MISLFLLSLCFNIILAEKGRECYEGKICWPKCCPKGLSYDVATMQCSDLRLPLEHPSVYELKINEAENLTTLLPLPNDTLTPIYDFKTQLEVACQGKVNLKFVSNGSVNLLSNGQLYLEDNDSAEFFEGGFCIENFVDLSEDYSEMAVFLCFPSRPIASFSSPLLQEEPIDNNDDNNDENDDDDDDDDGEDNNDNNSSFDRKVSQFLLK
jgi:hypothetical protein